MNQAEIDETEINIPVVNVDPLFNDHVTTDEMLKLVRTLKNNKSSGNDQVLNEFLKYCRFQLKQPSPSGFKYM